MEEEEGDRKRQTEGSRNVFVKDHFHPTRLASYAPQSPPHRQRKDSPITLHELSQDSR